MEIEPYANGWVYEIGRETGLCLPLAGSCGLVFHSTSHLIYASTKLRSNQGRAFRESSQRVVRSGQLAYESFVTRQTVFQSSNVCDTAADVLGLVFCFCGCCGEGRSVQSHSS